MHAVSRLSAAFLLCSLTLAAVPRSATAQESPPQAPDGGQAREQDGQQPQPATQPRTPPGPGTPPAPSEEELASARPIVFQLRARGELGFSADLRDEPGDFTVTRLGSGLSAQIPVRQYAQLDAGLDYEFSNYSFSGATAFAPGFDSPWEEIHRETLSLRFSQQQSLRVGWFVGGSLGLSHEDGADLGDSLVMSGFGGVRYAVNEALTVGAGLVVATQLEDSALVYPLLTLDWRLSDKVRLTNGGRLGLALAYEASEQVTFSFGASYERREFRLREDGPAPDGVGRDQRIPVVAGVSFRPTPNLSIELAGGASFGQSLRLMDEEGDTIADIDARPSPFASVLVGYRF